MLPFVRLWYGRQSPYTWTDESGTDHRISQGEGIEQGDPLAPLLFSLAIHRALRNAQDFLEDGDSMFAFLDDVYTIASRDRAAAITDHVAKEIEEWASVKPKLGKSALWSRQGGSEPPGVDALLRGQPRPTTPLWKGDLDPA